MTRKKVALVTGASSGIGYATAIEFAKRGYKVYACARRLEPMQPLTKHGIIIKTCDVTVVESVEDLKQTIIANEDGYLDCLFNNAGQPCAFPAIDVTDEVVTKCFEVNVFAPIRLTREFAQLLIKAKGTVGFTGSVSGIIPFPFSCVYSATKAAIHSYAATLRLELKPFGVKVINIVTGGVKSDIADKRELSAFSLYQVPGIEEALTERRQLAARNNPMSAEKYAYQVVNDFEYQTLGGKLNVYRGQMATFLGYLLNWCPRFLVERFLIKKFKLQGVFATISRKYSKEQA